MKVNLKQIAINFTLALIIIAGNSADGYWYYERWSWVFSHFVFTSIPFYLIFILPIVSLILFIISLFVKKEKFSLVAEISVIISNAYSFVANIISRGIGEISTSLHLLAFIMLVILYFNIKKADFYFVIEKAVEKQGEMTGEIIEEKEEMEKTVFCKNCGKEMTEAQDYCLQCGVKAKSGKSYCRNCGTKLPAEAAICVSCGMLVEEEKKGGKSKVTAGLLGLFLGGLGIHNFYLGYKGKAIAQLLLCWTGIPAIWALIESIMILTGSINKDAEGNLLQ